MRASTACGRPRLTDVGRVVGGSEDELGCTVVPRADIADVGLAGDEDLGRAKVTELEDARGRVQQQVLWLDIAMADAEGMNVGQRAKELVHVQLDLERRHGLLQFGVMTARTVDGLGDIFEDEVEVQFVFLQTPKVRGNQKDGAGERPAFSPLE